MHKMDDYAEAFVDMIIDAKVECTEEFSEDICINCKFNTTIGDFSGSCLLMTNYYALRSLCKI